MITGSCCLLVFAKVPRAGRVKTRLTPPLAPEAAARLYDAFLRDALDVYAAQASGEDPLGLGEAIAVYLYLDHAPPPGLAPEAVDVFEQAPGGLGEKMATAFAEAFAAGHERIVVVGTDHPTLPMELLGEAFRQLREPLACVVAPSDDGGYVFLGLNDLVPDLFEMDYSHEHVFEDTLERAARNSLSRVVMPEHYDVDTGEDLARLLAEWRGGAAVGPRTAAMLATLSARG